MDRNQINKLNMFEAEDQVLLNYNAVWSVNPAVKAAVILYRLHLQNINDNDALQKTSTKGTTLSKTDAQADMAAKAMVIAQAGMAYATATGNDVLFDNMNHTEYEITKSADTDADDICQNIYGALYPMFANTVNYGATAAAFTALQNAINTYSALIGKPKQMETLSIHATEVIATEIDNAIAVLDKQLTPILFQYKATNAPFYNQFLAARVIEDIGHRKTTVFGGHVYHGDNALAGVLVTLTGTNHLGNAVNIQKHTDANGFYHIMRQHYGDYTITVSLSGYANTAPAVLQVMENRTVTTDFTLTAIGGGGTVNNSTPPVASA